MSPATEILLLIGLLVLMGLPAAVVRWITEPDYEPPTGVLVLLGVLFLVPALICHVLDRENW